MAAEQDLLKTLTLYAASVQKKGASKRLSCVPNTVPSEAEAAFRIEIVESSRMALDLRSGKRLDSLLLASQ
jgi:hypothetical protein